MSEQKQPGHRAGTLRNDRTIYGRSPITEAVIDIRTVAPELSIRALKHLGDSLEGFVHAGELIEIQQAIGRDEQTRTRRTVGVGYKSTSQNLIVQLRLEGFACSKLAPYERWESFRDSARSIWLQYVESSKPRVVRRTAVRFINKIAVPGPIRDFREFVNIHPSTPWDLTSPPAGLFLQIRRSLPEETTIVVNEAVVSEGEEVAIVLDFDVFSEVEREFDRDAVWNQIERLHVLADEAFESSITDRVRRDIR
jgi:uncharacterized protein (TIGR04255 family)